jgi:hypothetical protein
MDWRQPIEQQRPVAPAANERAEAHPTGFTDSDEYRRAGGDPDLLEFAIQARAYRERLRREARKL